MKQVLQQISFNTIRNGEFKPSAEQVKNQWLGNSPASSEEIEKAENRLNVILPDDYKLFLENCNGFPAISFTEPTFHQVNEIDYLKNVDPQLIEIWIETGNVEEGKMLEKSIIIAGKYEEQYFLLIPPTDPKTFWKYWKFAHWHPGEVEFQDLMSYWTDVLNFTKGL